MASTTDQGDTSVTDFAALLKSSERVEDPVPTLELIDRLPNAIPSDQLHELWQASVSQRALADADVARGNSTPLASQRLSAWSAIESTLRKTILDYTKADSAPATLENYWLAERAGKAGVYLIPAMRRLEGLLLRQRTILAFHWDDERNSYRQLESRLSAIVAAETTSDGDRIAAATQIIEAGNKCRSALFNVLTPLTREVRIAFDDCERLVQLFEPNAWAELHRWFKLTQTVLNARDSAVVQLSAALDLDLVMSGAIVSGDTGKDEQGKITLGLNATARFKELAQTMGNALVAGAYAEGAVSDERDALVRELIPVEPEATTSTTNSEHEIETSPRRHPIKSRVWFRVGTVAWWLVTLALVLFALVAAESTDMLFGSFAIVAVLMFGIRALVYYIVLGRPTLHERAGSGFVDLDMLEQELLHRGEGEGSTAPFAELKSRYGSRVPAQIVRNFVDGQLSKIRRERTTILTDADRQGTTINLQSLRERMTSETRGLPESKRSAQLTAMEIWLLQQEIKYGPELPIAVADSELTALESLEQGVRR